MTRSESTNAKVGDDGLAFERGVTEALRQIQSSSDNEKKTTLRKVVLARKVDLNLGASFTSNTDTDSARRRRARAAAAAIRGGAVIEEALLLA